MGRSAAGAYAVAGDIDDVLVEENLKLLRLLFETSQ